MAKVSIEILYTYFETGDKPTESQFVNLIDSFWHKDASISSNNIDGLQGLLDAKANKSDFDAHVANNQIHVSPEEKDVWNSSVSLSGFTNHVENNNVHVSSEEKNTWNSKAESDHTHAAYENAIDELSSNKADNQHVHISELVVSPTGNQPEANSFRIRQVGADSIFESTEDGSTWVVLQILSRE